MFVPPLRLLSKQTAGASRGLKENIDVAIKQLSALATDLDSKKTGGVTDNPKEESTVEMDQSWGRADRALAQWHQVQAKGDWQNKETAKAGYEMKAAALNLEESADWAGGEGQNGRFRSC
jgi:hypothetical protein